MKFSLAIPTPVNENSLGEIDRFIRGELAHIKGTDAKVSRTGSGVSVELESVDITIADEVEEAIVDAITKWMTATTL